MGIRDGVKGFWHGLSAFLPRVVAYGSVQLALYDAVKQRIMKSPRTARMEGLPLHVASSSVTSIFAVTALQPFDLISVRLMNQPSGHAYYGGFYDCARKVWRGEGIPGF